MFSETETSDVNEFLYLFTSDGKSFKKTVQRISQVTKSNYSHRKQQIEQWKNTDV